MCTNMHRVLNKTSLVKLFQEPSQNCCLPNTKSSNEWAMSEPTWKLFLNNNSWNRFIPTHLSYLSHLIINRNLFYLIAHYSLLKNEPAVMNLSFTLMSNLLQNIVEQCSLFLLFIFSSSTSIMRGKVLSRSKIWILDDENTWIFIPFPV